MSIKFKLVAVLALVSLVLGGAVWLELASAYRVEKKVQLFVPATGYLLGIAEVNTGIARQAKEALDYLVTGKPDDREDFSRLTNEVENGFDLWIKSAQTQSRLGVEGEQEDIDEARLVREAYLRWVGHVLGSFDLLDSGHLDLALKQYEEGSWRFLEKEIFEAIDAEMQDGFSEVENAYHELLIALGGRLWGSDVNTEILLSTHAAIDSVIAGCRVNSAIGRQFSALSTYLLTSNADSLERYQDLKSEAKRAIDDWFYAAYEQSLIVEHQYAKSVSNISKVITSLQALIELEEAAVKVKHAGDTRRALQMMIDGPMESPLGDHLPLMMFSALGAGGKELVELAERASHRGVMLIGITFLCTLVMVLHLGQHLLTSLQLLQEGMDALASGQLDKKIALAGNDEFGQLAEHFNRMSASLCASSQQIEELNAGLERRVAVRTRELAKANQELEAFNSAVSHDLRSPLSVVNGYSELLLEQQEARAPFVRDALLAIRDAGEKMEGIIGTLLDLSRIDTLELARVKIDLSRLVGDILERLQQRGEQRQVHFVLERNLIVDADPDLLQIVLENLLGNAWKYTAHESLTEIEVGCDYDENRRYFFIRDNGAGFDMAQADDLFKPFKRLHSAAQFEGTGVGLATVQRIIQCHGGDIWAEGEPGRGASFYFTLN